MKTKLLVTAVLADFAGFTAWVTWHHGIVGLFERAFANSATTLVFVDLSIALGLAMVWMWQDARRRGASALPYCALTLFTGSVGPLLYLLLRRDEAAREIPAWRSTASPISS